MNWAKLGMEIAQGLIPVLVMVLIALIAMGFSYLRKRVKWLDQIRVDEQVEQMVKNVVISLQEDIVEGFKEANEDGKLTPEEIAMIKQQALSNLMQLLTAEQQAVLATLTEDISAWLAGTIQRVLVEFKMETGSYGTKAGSFVELVEAPDDTPLAESLPE